MLFKNLDEIFVCTYALPPVSILQTNLPFLSGLKRIILAIFLVNQHLQQLMKIEHVAYLVAMFESL